MHSEYAWPELKKAKSSEFAKALHWKCTSFFFMPMKKAFTMRCANVSFTEDHKPSRTIDGICVAYVACVVFVGYGARVVFAASVACVAANS